LGVSSEGQKPDAVLPPKGFISLHFTGARWPFLELNFRYKKKLKGFPIKSKMNFGWKQKKGTAEPTLASVTALLLADT